MRWAVHVAHTGFQWGDLTERGDFKHLDIDGSIILKWISKKWEGEKARTGLLCLRIGRDGGHLGM
jgi:hypothetical protein